MKQPPHVPERRMSKRNAPWLAPFALVMFLLGIAAFGYVYDSYYERHCHSAGGTWHGFPHWSCTYPGGTP